MADNKRPILKIDPVDVFNPKPVMLKLKFDEPKETQGTYGTQYLYSVIHEGTEKTFFASQSLDGMIYETGAGKDDWLAIIRTGEGKDTRWNVKLVDANGNPVTGAGRKGKRESNQATQEPQQGASNPNQGSQQGGQPSRASQALSYEDRVAAFAMDEMAYWGSFQRATGHLDASKIKWQVDANACAYVIYRMAKDHGIELGPDGDPVEPPAPPPPPLTEAQINQKEAIINALATLPTEDGTVLERDEQTEADALSLVQSAHGVAGWHDLGREDALATHTAIKSSSTYEAALLNANDMPF